MSKKIKGSDIRKGFNYTDKALSYIDIALSYLDGFTENGGKIGGDVTLNPFEYLLLILKRVGGYDKIIDILTKFLNYGIVALEPVIKAHILTSLQNITPCALNLFISDKILKEGVTFSVNEFDLVNLLSNIPINNNDDLTDYGRYLYFGCEEFTVGEQVRNSEDFNAFLWYIINKSNGFRETWGHDKKYKNTGGKQTKKDGIVTLQYLEKGNFASFEGLTDIRELLPQTDVIKVFIGNAKPTNEADLEEIRKDIECNSLEIDKKNKEIKAKVLIIEARIKKSERKIKEIEKSLFSKDLTEAEFDDRVEKEYRKRDNDIKNHKEEIKQIKSDVLRLVREKQDFIKKMKEKTQNYRNINENYYYRKTVFQFNTDYIMSVRFLDSKVIVTQLLENLTNGMEVNVGGSFELKVLKEQITNIINKILKSDDYEVNDDFFTFSNSEYDSLLTRTELRNRGKLIFGEEENNAIYNADIKEILKNVDKITPNTTKEEREQIIKGSIREIYKHIQREEDNGYDDDYDYDISNNILERLLTNLAYVITLNLISPKIYLLIALNLKMMGEEPSFTIEEFIKNFEKLIVEIIVKIKDAIVNFILDEVNSIVKNLVSKFIELKSNEQLLYAKELMFLLYKSFKIYKKFFYRNNSDFNLDDVDYADIFEKEK